MIPIADHEWTDITLGEDLPPGHKMEAVLIDGGGYVVRITGPRAHVLGESDGLLEEAMERAYSWFKSVGSEL